MSDLPTRPALADVLGTLTSEPRGHWIARLNDPSRRSGPTLSGSVVRMDYAVERFRAPVRTVLTRITTTDPHEALELLQVREHAPEDDVRRAFVSTGTMSNGALCDAPDHMPDLVAWASLGIPAILRAEELARETVARAWPKDRPSPDRIVWHVADRGNGGRIVWRTSINNEIIVTADGRGTTPKGERAVRPVMDLWDMGLCLGGITADAVTLVVPPVGF